MNERVVFPFIPSLTLTLTMDAQEPLPIPDSSYRTCQCKFCAFVNTQRDELTPSPSRAILLQQESCGDQPQESLLDERENNNVLIKEVTAGLTQPEWGRRRVALSPTTPKRDSRAVVLGPSTCLATRSSPGRLAGTRSVDKCARPKRMSWNLRKRLPWRGFDKKSASICSV